MFIVLSALFSTVHFHFSGFAGRIGKGLGCHPPQRHPLGELVQGRAQRLGHAQAVPENDAGLFHICKGLHGYAEEDSGKASSSREAKFAAMEVSIK